jgi:hypothetical protein
MQKVEAAFIMSMDDPSNNIDYKFDALMREYAFAVSLSHHKRMDYYSSKTEDQSSLSPCPNVIQRWRNSCRACTTMLYSPAVPSYEAINSLRCASPVGGWIEIGHDGVGYWTRVMNACGIKALTVDIEMWWKLCDATGGGDDSYDMSTSVPSNRGMLVVCSPKNGKLAIECLRKYKGNTIAVVGEWQGTSASSRFLRRLAKRFTLTPSVTLPPLSERIYELSVWTRRPKRLSKKLRRKQEIAPRDVFPVVKKCRVAGCDSVSCTMFCCRLCRSAFVCEKHLHVLHDEWDISHSTEHASRLLPKLNLLRTYDIELASETGAKTMRSETIMAFNPYKHEAEYWTVDYRATMNDRYDNVTLRLPKIDEVKDWR